MLFLVLCLVCPLLTHVTIERAWQGQNFPSTKVSLQLDLKSCLQIVLSLCMIVVWSIFTNLMRTVQMALEVQIVHATRTVLLTNSKYRSHQHEERFPSNLLYSRPTTFRKCFISTSMTAHNHCLMYSNE